MTIASKRLLIAGIIIAAGIFIIDFYTPLGIADAVSYVLIVLLTLWSSRESHTLIAAIAVTALTLTGMLFSPAGEIASVFITNRVLALMSIWATALAILRFKKSEKESRRNRESLDALFTHATEGIIIFDQTGKIEMLNPEAEKQFGYDKQELAGKNMEALIPGYLKSIKENNGVIASIFPPGAMTTRVECTAIQKNGNKFPVEISLSSYLLGDVRFVVAFIMNITARKKQEEELKRSHEELRQYAHVLKETNAELENFAYISSHDLQEPLRKIQSFGDRLHSKDADKLSEDGKDYLARMLNASARMQKLINDLLSFSRLTSRSQSFSEVDLNKVAVEVMSDLEVAIENSHALIKLEQLPRVNGDPTQMRQLFQNLIGNALKFKKENEDPVIHISARNIKVLERNFIGLEFEDNGIGFDEKYTDKIFGIFQRLDGSRFEGSGIGLAICKKIASRHNGTISASSRAGEGSVFKVLLPCDHENS